MTDLSSIFIALALAVVVIGRLAMPFCKRLDERQKAVELAAARELGKLKGKLKPGIYTFCWAEGKLLEPTADHSVEATRTREVVVQFVAGNLRSRKLSEMPYRFQQQLLEQIRTALD